MGVFIEERSEEPL